MRTISRSSFMFILWVVDDTVCPAVFLPITLRRFCVLHLSSLHLSSLHLSSLYLFSLQLSFSQLFVDAKTEGVKSGETTLILTVSILMLCQNSYWCFIHSLYLYFQGINLNLNKLIYCVLILFCLVLKVDAFLISDTYYLKHDRYIQK